MWVEQKAWFNLMGLIITILLPGFSHCGVTGVGEQEIVKGQGGYLTFMGQVPDSGRSRILGNIGC